MKSIFAKFILASAFALTAPFAVGCSNDDEGVDDNGKAISDIDIGGDVTIDEGATKQVTATIEYADGTKLDVTNSSDLVWNIGDTGVATISASGLVTGVSKGATTIKATYQGKVNDEHALIVH